MSRWKGLVSMAPTSDERREVAEMLREQAYEGYGINLESMLYALGLDPDDEERGDEDVFEMLADLIDPTCHVVPFDEEGMRLSHCSKCGQPMLKPWPNFCPNCGARVVERGDA